MRDDVKVETVDLNRMTDLLENRKRREIDDIDAGVGERISIFNHKKDSSPGECKASKRENEAMRKRRKRNVFSTSRDHLNSDFVRDKRRAEQELLQLQHKYMQCSKYVGPGEKACIEIYDKFQTLVKEVNEKFHRFSYDHFEAPPNMEKETEKIKKKDPDAVQQTKEQKQPKQPSPVPNLQKNIENVGQTYFGDGVYSYSYKDIPKFHEDLEENFDGPQRNNKETSFRDDVLPLQNQRIETVKISNDGKAIPVKVPEAIGKRL